MTLPIVNIDGDIVTLRKISDAVTVFDGQLKTFAQDMVDTMFAANGVGLAAPQVGSNQNIFVMRTKEGLEKDTTDARVLVNPKITVKSKATAMGVEGCLSIPGIIGDVRRFESITCSYQDLDGATHAETFTGFEARIFQHELDHLWGVLFIDRADRVGRPKAA